jgi:hypothetical protein
MNELDRPNADEQTPGAPATPAAEPSAHEQEEKSRFQQRIDQLTAARRAAEERARLLEAQLIQSETEKRTQQPTGKPVKAETVGQMTRDEWNEWHAEDPAAAIEYLAEMKANKKAEQVISQMQQQSQALNAVESVYKAHPELREVMEGKRAPEETPFWQVYDEVAREMPDAKYLAKGPYIVMKEAERRMKESVAENKEKEIASAAAAAEAQRQTRVGSGYTAGSIPRPSSAASVKLTPEEEIIARKMRLTPEEYAKYK